MSDIVKSDFSYLEHYKPYISGAFWEEVIAQLHKDLLDDSVVRTDMRDLKKEDAAEILLSKLQTYLPQVTPQLSQILYRIDLKEEHLESLNDLPSDIYYRCLSELILKRTVQKVITRKLLSGEIS